MAAGSRERLFPHVRGIDALGSGTAMFPHDVRSLIELRRAQHLELSAMQPPDFHPAGGRVSSSTQRDVWLLLGTLRRDANGNRSMWGHSDGRAAVLSGVEESISLEGRRVGHKANRSGLGSRLFPDQRPGDRTGRNAVAWRYRCA